VFYFVLVHLPTTGVAICNMLTYIHIHQMRVWIPPPAKIQPTSVYSYFYIYICAPVYLSINGCASISASLYPSIDLCVSLSVYLYLYIYLCLSLSLCHYVYVYIYPGIHAFF